MSTCTPTRLPAHCMRFCKPCGERWPLSVPRKRECAESAGLQPCRPQLVGSGHKPGRPTPTRLPPLRGADRTVGVHAGQGGVTAVRTFGNMGRPFAAPYGATSASRHSISPAYCNPGGLREELGWKATDILGSSWIFWCHVDRLLQNLLDLLTCSVAKSWQQQNILDDLT